MVLEKIRQLYPELTKSQRRLADFIAASYREVAFMTASRLARRLGVNEATIIRFAQRLGYSGYPEFVQDIRAVVQDELGAKNLTTGETASGAALFSALAQQAEELRRSAGHISPQVASEALTALRAARRVYVIGQGLAFPLAQLFSATLRLVGADARCPQPDGLSLAIMLEEVDEQALVVALSVASESEVANTLRLAGEKGAHTLALAWSAISPSAQVAEWAINCPVEGVAPLPPVALLAALAQALAWAVAAERLEQVQSRLDQVAQTKEVIGGRKRR